MPSLKLVTSTYLMKLELRQPLLLRLVIFRALVVMKTNEILPMSPFLVLANL